MLPIDALGFRRGAGALALCCKTPGSPIIRCFAQAKLRGIRALRRPRGSHRPHQRRERRTFGSRHRIGRREGGLLGLLSAPPASIPPRFSRSKASSRSPKGHAQEFKTQALALQVGKRLRVLLSDNNAGIDDSAAGRRDSTAKVRRLPAGRSVDFLWLERASDWSTATTTAVIVAALKTMDDWDPADRRPMVVIGKTTKGYWPGAVDGKIPGFGDQVVGYKSHPYAMKMNSDYFVALAQTFEEALRRGVRRHPQGRGERSARAADPVQDQYRRGDVAARPQRPGRLAGGPPGGHWRHRQGRPAAAHRHRSTTRSWTTACAWPIFPWSRRR
jgi:hypothetical protein